MSERKLFSQYAQSTLEREDREQARRLNARGMHVLEIAKLFGLSRTTVSSVVNNHVRAREIKMQLAKEKSESTI